MFLDILSWIVTGLVIGALARLLLPGRQSIGLVATILLGIAGAFAGGLIASLFSGGFDRPVGEEGWYWPGWIMSIIGGVLVLWIYTSVTAERRKTPA